MENYTREKFISTLKEMVEKEHDDYKQLEYSPSFIVSVWSLDEEGTYEIEIIVPHDSDQFNSDEHDDSFGELSDSEQVYNEIVEAIEEVDENSKPFEFYLTEIVGVDAWEQPATVYSSFKKEV